jgi:hypothetical protein
MGEIERICTPMRVVRGGGGIYNTLYPEKADARSVLTALPLTDTWPPKRGWAGERLRLAKAVATTTTQQQITDHTFRSQTHSKERGFRGHIHNNVNAKRSR